MTNINWFVFGAVFLSVGFFVLTGSVAWAVTGFVTSFVFGLGCSAVWGAKAIVAKEKPKER